MPELVLAGCTPEPLLSYLKALGIIRLASQQDDPEARAAWRDERFVLSSRLDADGLVDFWLTRYSPTPIVAPWAGGSGFFAKDNKAAVDAIATSRTPRLQAYRDVIELVRNILVERNLRDKPTDDTKESLIREYRRRLPQPTVDWMDAALVLREESQAFAPVLGTGGNDGRLDFSRNFMERLVALGIHAKSTPRAADWLRAALFGSPAAGLLNSAVGQFAPGRSGGPNATQGFEGEPLDNPWDFVLMMEGTVMLAGAVTRRASVTPRDKAAFPFTVRASAVGFTSGAESDLEAARGEIWLPIWRRFASHPELAALFAEGRAQVGGRQARDAVDFARAVAGLGVDRGIGGFVRFAFLRRSGKAFLASALGRVAVVERPDRETSLLQEIDPWLDRFRSACGLESSPPRLRSTLRRLESMIFDVCRYGGRARFTAVLAALGRAEREISWSDPGALRLAPLCISTVWLEAADDGTAEFELARGAASVHDDRIGPLRMNLEPIDWMAWQKKNSCRWSDEDRSVVWTNPHLATNLARVVERRLLDAAADSDSNPVKGSAAVSLQAIVAFLAGDIDEPRLEDLIWGLSLIRPKPRDERPPDREPDMPLPRAFSLVKLLFLSDALEKPSGEQVRPDRRVVSLLKAGRITEACDMAARRLSAAAVMPMAPQVGGRAVWARHESGAAEARTGLRLCAALLFPVSRKAASVLRNQVIRPERDNTGSVGSRS